MDKQPPNFDLPPEMRAFAEKSVEQAKQAFDGFVKAARQAVNTAENQATTAHSGAKEVGELAMRFASRNISSSFELAQKLVQAKDVKEVMALNSEYAKQQMSALSEQAKELGQTAAKMGSAKP